MRRPYRGRSRRDEADMRCKRHREGNYRQQDDEQSQHRQRHAILPQEGASFTAKDHAEAAFQTTKKREPYHSATGRPSRSKGVEVARRLRSKDAAAEAVM